MLIGVPWVLGDRDWSPEIKFFCGFVFGFQPFAQLLNQQIAGPVQVSHPQDFVVAQ
jgi:hypothetical protein